MWHGHAAPLGAALFKRSTGDGGGGIDNPGTPPLTWAVIAVVTVLFIPALVLVCWMPWTTVRCF